MAKIEDDLRWENLRNEDSQKSMLTIRLCPSGGFWRAYNRSAWLLLNLSRGMKVHVVIRGGVKIAQVGFPVANVSNWLPQGYAFEISADGFALMKPSENNPSSITDTIKPTYSQWLESLEVSPGRDKRKTVKNPRVGSLMSEMDLDENKLILQILAFPVENRTPLECASFISELKVKLTSMLSQRLQVPESITGKADGDSLINDSNQKE